MADDDPKKTEIQVSVCMGTNCAFRGAAQLIETLRTDEEINSYCTIIETSCLNEKCDHARYSPVVKIGDEYFTQAKPEALLDALHALIIDRQSEAREP